MPKNAPKRPQHVIDEAVKRHLAGEPVSTLAKHYKISRAGFYLWVAKAKQAMLAKASTVDMTPKEKELSDKRVLIAEIQALRLENRRLRELVLDGMIRKGGT